jgi:hypothetical protein
MYPLRPPLPGRAIAAGKAPDLTSAGYRDDQATDNRTHATEPSQSGRWKQVYDEFLDGKRVEQSRRSRRPQ